MNVDKRRTNKEWINGNGDHISLLYVISLNTFTDPELKY